MGLKTLTKAKAFDAGSELWVVPEPEHCPLAQRVDWYLNFQLARARHHKTRELSPELKNTLIQQEWPEFQYSSEEDSPLMVAATGYFPTEMVVQVPVKRTFKTWVKNIQATWNKLDTPSMRVFLPDGKSVQEFKTEWEGSVEPYELSVVPS